MKTKLITAGLIVSCGLVNAQALWNGAGYTGNAWRVGNIGINQSSPVMALDLVTSSVNNGLGITQTGSGFAALRLFNTTTGGRNYALVSTGNGNGEGAGHFGLFDYTSLTYRLFVQSATGRVGIGTISPTNQLQIETDDTNMANNPLSVSSVATEPTFQTTYSKLTVSSKVNVHAAIQGHDVSNGPASNCYLNTGIGVFGKAERTVGGSNCNVVNIGVFGKATGAWYDIGGVFVGDVGTETQGRSASSGDAGSGRYGIWASASVNNGAAAYLNGSSYSNNYFQGADDNLKESSQPLVNSVEKLKLLKATSFTFKSSENRGMNLPEGNQMGLNVPEVEKNFPELVKEFTDLSGQVKNNTAGKATAYKAINYTSLIPLLIAGVQEQQTQLDEQKKENEALKNLVEMQQQQINDLLTKAGGSTGINAPGTGMDGFSMDQNVPNPFSNETVINYNLPQQYVKANMVVYDLSGKQISSIPLTQKGKAFITINADKLAAGMYIYSIIADGKVMDSKRMVVNAKD